MFCDYPTEEDFEAMDDYPTEEDFEAMEQAALEEILCG
jgi:hypothetical protein